MQGWASLPHCFTALPVARQGAGPTCKACVVILFVVDLQGAARGAGERDEDRPNILLGSACYATHSSASWHTSVMSAVCSGAASRPWGLLCKGGIATQAPLRAASGTCAQRVRQGLRTSRRATVHSSIMVASVPTRQQVRTASVLQPFLRILMLALHMQPPSRSTCDSCVHAQPPGSSLLHKQQAG